MSLPPCPVCGQSHDPLPSADYEAPTQMMATPPERRDRWTLSGDLAAFDDKAWFIRGVLALPVRDHEGAWFDLGLWISVGPEDFAQVERALAGQGRLPDEAYGFVASAFDGYPDTMDLKAALDFRRREAPRIVLEPTEHPLAAQQRGGIAAADAMTWLHAHGGL